MLPPAGEIHERPGLGLPHGAGLAIEGAGPISGSIGQAPSMDRVYSSGVEGGPSLSLNAMRQAGRLGTGRPPFS
jgi:hypothetical protein